MYSSVDACVRMSGRSFTHSDRDEPALKCSQWIDLHALPGDIYSALDQDDGITTTEPQQLPFYSGLRSYLETSHQHPLVLCRGPP